MADTRYKLGIYNYDPDVHENHRKPWTVNDRAYLCGSAGKITLAQISLNLGRSHGTVRTMLSVMRKSGEFGHYIEIYRRSCNGNEN